MTDRRRLAAANALVAVTVTGAMAGCAMGRGAGGPLDPGPPSPPPHPAGLAERVVETLENDPRFLRDITLHHDRLACVAEPFGTEPRTVAAVADVEVVYSQVFCAAVGPGGPTDAGTRVSLPIALTFGPPVAYQTPGDGAGYRDRVREIFPRRCWEHAFAGFADPQAAAAALDERVALIARTPAVRAS